MAQAEGSELRSVYAGYHWFGDWGRDTMISLEGLTLVHRPLSRGRRDPAYVFALRARRPAAEPVSRRRARSAVSHGRCDAVVLPRDRALRRSHRRSLDPAAAVSRCSPSIDRASPRGHALQHPRRSGRRPARGRRPRAISSRGWMRRSTAGSSRRVAASRWRSRRSGTTRCKLMAAWGEELGAEHRSYDAHAQARPRNVQRALLERAHRLPVRRDRRTGRRRCEHPPEPGVRDLAASSDSLRAPLGAGARHGAQPARDGVRTAHAQRRASRLQGALPRRPALARRGVSPGHGLAVAHRPLHRRVPAECVRIASARASCCARFPSICAKRASAASARSSTPRIRTRRAAASRRRGASRKCCARGCARASAVDSAEPCVDCASFQSRHAAALHREFLKERAMARSTSPAAAPMHRATRSRCSSRITAPCPRCSRNSRRRMRKNSRRSRSASANC